MNPTSFKFKIEKTKEEEKIKAVFFAPPQKKNLKRKSQKTINTIKKHEAMLNSFRLTLGLTLGVRWFINNN